MGARQFIAGFKGSILESSIFLAPALILAVQMSGKGFTNSFLVGGTVGLALLWAIALALIFKFAIVDGLARYTLAKGESIFSTLPELPGPRHWGIWAMIFIYTFELMAYASIALFAASVLEELFPGNQPVTATAMLVVLVVLVMLLWRSLGFLEKTVYFIIAVVISLMAYTLVATLLYNPTIQPISGLTQTKLIDDFMLLLGSGSGLALLLYSEWVSEKIKRVPAGMPKRKVLTGVRISLVFAFLITGVFSFIIMTVAAYSGTGQISDFQEASIGSIPFVVPTFILSVALLMFGIVYVGIDGRARAISRMIRRMGLTKMESMPLYRTLSICFVAILLAALMIGEPTNVMALISSFSSVMFAIVGFTLIYLNSKLMPPYRAGKLWIGFAGAGSTVFLIIALVNERTFLEFGVPMLIRLALVTLALFLMIRYGLLKWVMNNIHRLRGAIVMVAVFGAISIFGSIGGIEYNGAVINFRDLGAMMAGILGGPMIGLMVGLVGGAFRYGMGGWTVVPCFIATISAGLVSGLLSRHWKGSLSYLKIGFLAILVEGMHLFLYFPLLTLDHPFSDVADVINNITVPMMVINLVGLMVFYYCLDRWGSGIRATCSFLIGKGKDAEKVSPVVKERE